MSKSVKKTIQRSEEKRGFIHLPKDIQVELALQEITLLINDKKMRFRIDKHHRIWLGKAVMRNLGLREGLTINLERISDREIKLSQPTLEPSPPEKQEKKPTLHNFIRDIIHQIGILKGLVSEKEYLIEGMRLDVVWKKIERGYPVIVFEVQIGGNIFEALTKLKHAWDLWNSIPFLVTTEEYRGRAMHLVEGSFHEMRRVIRIVNWNQIEKLHKALTKTKEIERELRIPKI